MQVFFCLVRIAYLFSGNAEGLLANTEPFPPIINSVVCGTKHIPRDHRAAGDSHLNEMRRDKGEDE
jgi:hypothetical protein